VSDCILNENMIIIIMIICTYDQISAKQLIPKNFIKKDF